jgi:mannitol-1-phosphate 5-dehydrogenase
MPILNSMKKACHFGAGNIGRGFIGLILNQAEFQVSFADVNASLIHQLNELKEYAVETITTPSQRFIVNVGLCFDINNDIDELIENASEMDLLTTAVGPNILPKIAPVFAKILESRFEKKIHKNMNIIACENVIAGSELLKNEIFKHLSNNAKEFVEAWIGFPNSAVDRIVPIQENQEPLLVKVEQYYEWVIDKTKSKGDLVIDGALFTDKLDAYIERKLYLVNAGHAAIAYIGYHKGVQTICDALSDNEIYEHVFAQMLEAATLLSIKHGFNFAELEKYAKTTLNRFSNPDITDSVNRVGRSPMRKLSSNDRFIKPLNELYKYNCESKHFEKSIHYALMYDFFEDEEAVKLSKMINSLGIKQTLSKVSGIEADHPLVKAIIELSRNV